MKKNALIKRISVTCIVAIALWLFWPAPPEQQKKTPEIAEHRPIIKTIASTTSQKAVKNNDENAVMPALITSNESATFVAKAYAAELTFPAYSQPLTAQDFDRLQPNHFNPQSIPVDDTGTSISAGLSKYRYTYPEPVIASLSGDNIDFAEISLVDIDSGKYLLTRKFKQDESNNWQAQFAGERDFPSQLQATVTASVNGKTITIALALKYVDSVATIESFDPAFSRESDMVINANLTTREQGLYRVRANLFDANKQPIAHLVSKEKLSKGSAKIALKAHQSVLQGKQAPFYLSTFTIELMSPAPGKPTKYGDSAVNQFEIKDFATSSLSTVPYQPSEQEQQRLQLLQNMAQGG